MELLLQLVAVETILKIILSSTGMKRVISSYQYYTEKNWQLNATNVQTNSSTPESYVIKYKTIIVLQ